MQILFDQGTPVPLRRHLTGHVVDTAFERAWSRLENGELLDAAEQDGYGLLITTDQNLKHQQHLSGRQLAVIVWLLLFSLPHLFGPLHLQAEEARRPRSPLEAVKELDKPITVTETKIPLGDLVQKVAADTGVRLNAHASTADEPVTVVVREMPARRLLEELAGHLDYLWLRQGKSGEAR